MFMVPDNEQNMKMKRDVIQTLFLFFKCLPQQICTAVTRLELPSFFLLLLFIGIAGFFMCLR